jgi:hypothetical protein
MTRRFLLSTAAAVNLAGLGLIFCMTSPGHAIDDDRNTVHPRTVLTLSRTGAWGAGTDYATNTAIASAIRHCKAMSTVATDCGSKFTSIFAGWSVAVLCGDQTIVAAARRLHDAERAAVERETELRVVYRRDMPACVRVVTIDPDGRAVVAAGQAISRRR